jgi:micrococcal nuclease
MNEWQIKNRRRAARLRFGVAVVVIAVLGGAWLWASGDSGMFTRPGTVAPASGPDALPGGVTPAAPESTAPDGTVPADSAVVDRVIDGDTVDVLLGGAVTRVRLLNIDTPETKKENTPIECLGPEASDFLTALLPVGSTISLEYDVERADQYGRTLAAVFTADGQNASVELASRGLGYSVLFEPNDRYLADVERAETDARTAGRGLFDPSVACNAAG